MKTTVRLSIYDEDGIQQPGYLEVNSEYFLTGPARHFGRVVQPEETLAQWEIDLLNSAYEEAKEVKKTSQPKMWEDLYGLIPSDKFEINRDGVIRIKSNKKVIEPTWFDIDQNKYNVMLKINGMEYYLNGPKIAEELWGK